MATNDSGSSTPADRTLKPITETNILAEWRRLSKALTAAKVAYAQAYLQAKIRKESDGTAHQIAIEETRGETTQLESDIDIIKAMYYARSRK